MHEFDAFALDYSENASHWVKRWLHITDASLLEQKVAIVQSLVPANKEVTVLDFGCGTGNLLGSLAQRLPSARLIGVDASQEMIRVAQNRHNSNQIQFHSTKNFFELADRPTVDFVIVSSVLHHIEPQEQFDAMTTIKSVMGTGAQLIVFEHNPRNVVTRLVVSNTPIDRNAILIQPSELVEAISDLGFDFEKPEYFLTVPPAFPFSKFIDRGLRRLAIGGQWLMIGKTK